jgi:hypothetical protein
VNAQTSLGQCLRRYLWRLLIVVMLAVAVTGTTYAVSVSPVGTSFAGTGRRPPGRPATQTVASSEAAPANAAPAVSAPDDSQHATAAPQASAAQSPTGGRPSRGGSLARGLPELGMYAGAVAGIVVVVNSVRMLGQSIRRRQGGTRAPTITSSRPPVADE